MVGFLGTNKEEENKKNSEDSFCYSLPDTYDFCLPFTDSCSDFDPIMEWLEEDPPIGPPPYSMDDIDHMGSDGFCEKDTSVNVETEKLGTFDFLDTDKSSEMGVKVESLVDFVVESGDVGAVEKLIEKGSDEFCEEAASVNDEAEKVRAFGFLDKEKSGEMGVKVESFVDFVVGKGDNGALEKSIEGGNGALESSIEGFEGVEKIESKLAELGEVRFSIEEELKRVSLNRELNDIEKAGMARGKINNGRMVGEEASVAITDSICNGVKQSAAILSGDGNGGGEKGLPGDKDGSASESESESDSGSSASDSSSDEDDGDKDKEEKEERDTELEEGEIMTFEEEEMVAWSDDEDEAGGNAMNGPIRSKNELADLPPVPAVNVRLLQHHHTLPVGIISSILGHQVIVEGVERHNPLSEGSIVWITESRSPLGIVDEIFGPVKNPYYIVRYNSETEVPAGIQKGTQISFVPEFADHVLNNTNLYRKGYDASGENDEELSEEAEFSDDEKEAEYRRMQKIKKRGTNDDKDENKKKDKRNSKNRFAVGKHEQSTAKQTHDVANNVSTQHFVQPPGVSSGTRPVFSSGLTPSSPLPRSGMASGSSATTSNNNVWLNGNLSQPTVGTGFPINPQMQGMPWLQGNHPQLFAQTPYLNGTPFQQNIHMNPSLPSNFGPGSGFTSWPGGVSPNFLNQTLFGLGMQGQNPSTLINIGANVSSSGFQQGNVAQNIFNQSVIGMGMQGHNASTPNGFQQAKSNPGQDTFGNFNHGNNRGGGMQGQNAPTLTNNGANVSSSGFQQGNMAQNLFNQSIIGMGMQGHNASAPDGFQQSAKSNPGQDSFQNFNHGNNRGGGRRLYHRGGGRFGGGRGRRSC